MTDLTRRWEHLFPGRYPENGHCPACGRLSVAPPRPLWSFYSCLSCSTSFVLRPPWGGVFCGACLKGAERDESTNVVAPL